MSSTISRGPSPIPPSPSPSENLRTDRLVANLLPVRLPSPISRAVAFADGARLLLAGGLGPAGTTNHLVEVDPATGVAHVVGVLAIGVHDAGGAILGGVPTVFGGGNVSPATVVQTAFAGPGMLLGNLPSARADLVAVTVGSRALVIGGGTPSALDRDVLATDDGIHFTVLARLAFGTRYPAVAVDPASGWVIVVGGTDGTHDLSVIQAVNPSTGAVTVLGRLPRGLSHAAAVVLDGRIFVAGGRNAGRAQDTIWQVDPTTGTPSVVGRLPLAISDMAAVVVDGTGYLLGGETTVFQRSIIELALN